MSTICALENPKIIKETYLGSAYGMGVETRIKNLNATLLDLAQEHGVVNVDEQSLDVLAHLISRIVYTFDEEYLEGG